MVDLVLDKPRLACDEVRALAKTHGIEADKKPLDFMADKFAELSGDTPVDDEVEQLCTNLFRAGVLGKAESTALFIRYLKGE